VTNKRLAEATMRIEELFLFGGPLKGKLLVATPEHRRPRDVPLETWLIELVRSANQNGKYRLAIPATFWKGLAPDFGHPELDGLSTIAVADSLEPADGHGRRPADSIEQITRALSAGEDVLVLTSTQEVSGFIPAVLGLLADPQVHPEKVLYSIVKGESYSLTPFELGYVYGLADSEGLRRR
jgi:hypothetical protein